MASGSSAMRRISGEIVGDNNTDLKISVMADVGRTDFKRISYLSLKVL